MAELAIGVVALAGLFNDGVECFRMVQLARSCAKDFKTCQLQLDGHLLRFSRWGRALGLDDISQPDQVDRSRFKCQEDVDLARDYTQQLLELFQDAERASSKMQKRPSAKTTDMTLYSPHTDLEPSVRDLHQRLQQLAQARSTKTSLLTRVKWAIYKESEFRDLLEDISGLIGQLEQLFPAIDEARVALASQEVEAIKTSEELPLLKSVVEADDKVFASALEQVAGVTGNASRVTMSGTYHKSVVTGTISGGQMTNNIS